MKIWQILEALKLGGPGSGNWAHAGRIGHRGGSLPRGTAMSIHGKEWEARYVEKALGGGTVVSILDYPKTIKDLSYALPGVNTGSAIKSMCIPGVTNKVRAYYDEGKDKYRLFNSLAGGEGSISLLLDKGNGDFHLDYIVLPGSIQGSGNLREKVPMWAAMARQSGYNQLSLEADISVGKYAWAKMGFNFASSHQWERFHERLESKADQFGIKVPHVLRTAKDMAEWNPGIKIRPSQLGAVMEGVKDDPTVFGKAFLLSEHSWYGVLKL